jgi:hypothetical protein
VRCIARQEGGKETQCLPLFSSLPVPPYLVKSHINKQTEDKAEHRYS